MFYRLQTHHIARWLIAALMFSLLHPAFAMAVADPQRDGDTVQICTGAGMAWVRLTAPAPQPAQPQAAQDAAPDAAPTQGNAGATAGTMPCPFCLGAALAPGPADDNCQRFDWPLPPAPVPEAAPACVAPAARVILDAPTRGPPGAIPRA